MGGIMTNLDIATIALFAFAGPLIASPVGFRMVMRLSGRPKSQIPELDDALDGIIRVSRSALSAFVVTKILSCEVDLFASEAMSAVSLATVFAVTWLLLGWLKKRKDRWEGL